jgi:lipopolysaccharide/colanic/teichoic acid biosynthesis glycosyltransferase
MRRSFDVLCAVLGLIILSPFFAVIALAIKKKDNGPVFYRAQRVGLNGKLFALLKFRTMVVDADKTGVGVTRATDQRITTVGRFLRRYKLDEFPQLINIIRGEMNLVGPRPEDPRYTRLYDQKQQMIFSMRPGITSPASLYFRDESSLLDGPEWEEKYIHEIMPEKLSIDLKYFETNTLWSDFSIILRTLRGVTFPGLGSRCRSGIR